MFVTRKSAIAENRATHLCKRNGVADLKHVSNHCCHAEFGRSALKCVDINIGEPPKWGAVELRCLGTGNVANPKIHAFSPIYVRVTTSN